MKRTVRTLAMILAIVLAFALMAGCGDNAGSVGTSSPAPAQSAAGSASVSEPTEAPETREPEPEKPASLLPICDEEVTLSIFTILQPGVSTRVDDANGLYAFSRLEELTNVHLEHKMATTPTAAQVMGVLTASNDYPDIWTCLNNFYTGGLTKALEDGVIEDLTDILDEKFPNFQKIRTSSDVYLKGSTLDSGKVVDLAQFYVEGKPVNYGPVIRQDWLDDLKLETPVTYDDYYNVLTAFKTEKGADSALWVSCTGTTVGNYFCAGFGVSTFYFAGAPYKPFFQVDGQVRFAAFEEGYKEYMKLFSKWYSEGLIYRDFASGGLMMDDSLVAEGRTGVFTTYAAAISSYKDKVADPNLKLAAAYDPVKNAGDSNHFVADSALVASGASISTTCADFDVACAWLDFSYSEEGQLFMNYGVEGETFEYVDGKPQFSDVVLNNPDGMGFSDAISFYTRFYGPGLTDWHRELAGYSQAQLDSVDIWGKGDEAYVIPQVVTMTVDESAEYATASTEVLTHYQEMTLRFLTGEADIDTEYDDFVRNLKALGADDCMALWQAALDRYQER